MRLATAGLLLLASAGVCSGQGFPLRPGEWEAKTEAAGQSMTLLFCFTDETWRKALTQNPICKVEQLSVTSTGMHYFVDCEGKTFQMKGPAEMIFDGMEHMTGKGTFTGVAGGKTISTQSQTEYHWKNAACRPTDVNLRAKSAH